MIRYAVRGAATQRAQAGAKHRETHARRLSSTRRAPRRQRRRCGARVAHWHRSNGAARSPGHCRCLPAAAHPRQCASLGQRPMNEIVLSLSARWRALRPMSTARNQARVLALVHCILQIVKFNLILRGRKEKKRKRKEKREKKKNTPAGLRLLTNTHRYLLLVRTPSPPRAPSRDRRQSSRARRGRSRAGEQVFVVLC